MRPIKLVVAIVLFTMLALVALRADAQIGLGSSLDESATAASSSSGAEVESRGRTGPRLKLGVALAILPVQILEQPRTRRGLRQVGAQQGLRQVGTRRTLRQVGTRRTLRQVGARQDYVKSGLDEH